MKRKTNVWVALMAMLACFAFVSCNNNEDDPIELDPTIKKTVADEVMELSPVELSKKSKTDTPIVIHFKNSDCPLEKIVILDTESLLYPKQTRAISSDVITCPYTIDGDVITIKSGSAYGDIVVKLGDVIEVTINDITYTADQESLPEPDSASEVGLCRCWTNAKYSAGIYFDKLPIYGANEAEKAEKSDVRNLKDAIMNKLMAEKGLKDEGFAFLNDNITGVNFLTNGIVYITYSSGRVEESAWKWIDEAKAKLNTTIDGVKVDVDVRFKSGTPNTAYFVIDANLQGVGGLGVHTLSGKLVCKMTD